MNRADIRTQLRDAERERDYYRRRFESFKETYDNWAVGAAKQFAITMALAIYETHGWKRQGVIRIVEEASAQMKRIWDKHVTVEDLERELKEKTGLEFTWKD